MVKRLTLKHLTCVISVQSFSLGFETSKVSTFFHMLFIMYKSPKCDFVLVEHYINTSGYSINKPIYICIIFDKSTFTFDSSQIRSKILRSSDPETISSGFDTPPYSEYPTYTRFDKRELLADNILRVHTTRGAHFSTAPAVHLSLHLILLWSMSIIHPFAI